MVVFSEWLEENGVDSKLFFENCVSSYKEAVTKQVVNTNTITTLVAAAFVWETGGNAIRSNVGDAYAFYYSLTSDWTNLVAKVGTENIKVGFSTGIDISNATYTNLK